ncbi:MAG: DUF1329 domain-containing protein [Deltaproteobacteria bacterium]|nr:DUF1329 domain-containing protein [Deltaproteobacteria bacterium]
MERRESLLAALIVLVLCSPAFAVDPKPGTIITKLDHEAYDELMPPSVRNFLELGMKIEVRAPESCPWPHAFIEATEKYSAQVKLTDDRRALRGYVAGMPFAKIDPADPAAAWKIMWNHEHKPAFSDDVRTEWTIDNQDDTGYVEKTLSSEVWRRLKWEGRVVLAPTPTIAHDPAIRYTEQWGPIQTPFDLVGAGFLLYRYEDVTRPDDSWLYLPQLRRVRRYSSADRSGTLFGTDIDQDSIWGFNSKPELWDFRMLGEKEILVPMHAGKYATADIWCDSKGTASWVPCVQWEKRKVWVVEGKPTFLRPYAFSKRHLWIDAEVFNVSTSEMFDKREELWKVWQNVFWCTTSVRDGRKYPDQRLFTPAVAMVDFQLRHSSRILPPGPGNPLRYDWMFETGDASENTPDFYTIASMVSGAR